MCRCNGANVRRQWRRPLRKVSDYKVCNRASGSIGLLYFGGLAAIWIYYALSVIVESCLIQDMWNSWVC
jgi:hypothetical protein